jgi:hypothetical protein
MEKYEIWQVTEISVELKIIKDRIKLFLLMKIDYDSLNKFLQIGIHSKLNIDSMEFEKVRKYLDNT